MSRFTQAVEMVAYDVMLVHELTKPVEIQRDQWELRVQLTFATSKLTLITVTPKSIPDNNKINVTLVIVVKSTRVIQALSKISIYAIPNRTVEASKAYRIGTNETKIEIAEIEILRRVQKNWFGLDELLWRKTLTVMMSTHSRFKQMQKENTQVICRTIPWMKRMKTRLILPPICYWPHKIARKIQKKHFTN